MHLKSLEVLGFKSFADKTVFDFHEGITAIVGPNGCGKSNVLDAVRWVLGEQSAKALRGGEMADVIFNGTDNRKPLGFAEVSLTFTDCAADLSVEWNEVRVTRRVFRDGNSEYLLNKQVCRLKDIQSLFADTGVGRSAYSMMEQGKIDLILSSRPEDRRTVFEEAAGITRYKTQKKEALRKLEATEANLLRVGDIIKEVKRQIGSLQRQAGKARRYQALHADLKVLDTHFSHRKMQMLDHELAACAEKLEKIGQTEHETRELIETDERRISELREQLDEIDAQITAIRSELQRHQGEIASHKHRIEFNQQRREELRELIAKHETEIGSAQTKLSEQQSALAAAAALLDETARLLETKRTELGTHDRSVAQLRSARGEHDRRLQELQVAIAKDEAKRAALEDELASLGERRASSLARVAEVDAAIASASSGHEELEATVKTARDAAQADAHTIEQLQQNIHDAEAQSEMQQRELNDFERRLSSVERAIAEKQSRIEVLRQLNEEGEGLAQGSQALLKQSEFADAFGGALAAQIEAGPEYVRAIEAALGRNLQALVLTKSELAGAIVEHVRAHELGQAALLLPQHSDTPADEALPAKAICWAIEKVRSAENVNALIARLLRGVALFENISDALDAKANAPEIGAATLNGEFISRDGILFAGTAAGRSNSILERNARIAALESEHANVIAERDELVVKGEELRSSHSAATESLASARSAHASAIAAQNASASKVSVLEREHADASHRLESLRNDSATLARQLEEADGRLAELRLLIETTDSRINDAQNELTRLQTARAEALRAEEDAIARAAELRLVVASHEQRHQTLSEQQEPMLARERELSEAIAARRDDIATYQQRIAVGERETVDAQRAIETQTTSAGELQHHIERLNGERAALNEEINVLETSLRQMRNSLNDLHDKRGAEQVRQTQLQLQREHLAEHVSQRYQLDLREFAPDSYSYNKVLSVHLKRTSSRDDSAESAEAASVDISAVGEEQLQTLIAELTRQLDNMGPVNLDAVQEYDELEERHKFLETQLNDLTNSKRELLEVIARINSTTQKLFAETFAQVRINFREMFSELFGGGRADLQLLDESNPLECGIDIIAKPPGKQLQSVSLLSGGERTMTAVALLFAIYMVRPSPFCILDEMDAPLDESNINRFIKMLDRFVEQSQFIIITHNKRTIAKADVLYGVTMEERGVSKLVGMKMAPAPAVGTAPAQPSVPAPAQQQFAIDERDESKHVVAH